MLSYHTQAQSLPNEKKISKNMYLEGWGTKNYFLKYNLVVLYRKLILLFKKL
jgi:AAA15 family ATPase/GTPase